MSRRRTSSSDALHTSLTSKVGVNAMLLLAAIYFLAPIWWLVVAASKEPGMQFTAPGFWFNGFGMGDGIRKVFETDDGIFLRWMGNSLLYAGLSALIGTFLSVMAGYALAKYEFKGRGLIFGVVLASVLIPKVLFTLPLYLMFNEIGLLNNPLAVILPSVVSPFGVYLARVFASTAVPTELLEAGRIDGASEFRIFRSIVLKMMGPALVTVFLFQFVEVWNNFLLPLMVLNDSKLQPVTVGLVGWSDSNGQVPAGTVVVAAFLSVLPLILIFLLLQRYWRAGLTAGAVK